MPSDLTCPDCGTVYEAGPDEPWRCACGHALEFVDRPLPEGDPLPLHDLDTTHGLWTFFEFVPIERHVSLGEGFTPLVEAPDWDAQFKLEYVFPTGSFKDRGATTTLSRAVELGVEKVIEDSSGNAGAAIATYAARAGLEADVYVPADVSQSKLMAIQRAGARPIRVEGSREDVTAACIEAVESEDDAVSTSAVPDGPDRHAPGDSDSRRRDDRAPRQVGEGWYASHAWNPAFYAGTMTFAFEVAAQRGWTAPDAIVLPIGHGTLFLGAYRGFSLLQEAGIVDELPRLLGAQATGYAPIAAAVDGGESAGELGTGEAGLDAVEVGIDDAGPAERNEIAGGIQIDDPAREDQILAAIDATDGDAIALEADPVESALDRLHRGGFYVEPTCAVAPAALRRYREDGVLSASDDVVVPLTGSGLKTL